MLLIVFPHFALLGTPPRIIFDALHFFFPGLHQLVIALAKLLLLKGQRERGSSETCLGRATPPGLALCAAQAERESFCLKKYNLLGHGCAPGPGTNPRVNSQNRPSGTLRFFPSRPNVFGGTRTLTHPSHLLEHPLAQQILDSAAKGSVLGREPVLHTPGESKVPA